MMIEILLSMTVLAMAAYAVWISLDATSCQRELEAMERRVNGFRDGMSELIHRTDKLENKAEEFAWTDQDIRNEIHKIYGDVKNIGATTRRLDGDLQEVRGDMSILTQDVKELDLKVDRTKACFDKIKSALTEGAKVTQKWFPEN